MLNYTRVHLRNILLTGFTAKTVSVPMIIQVIHACLILINGTNDARPNGLFRVHISVNTVTAAIKHIYMGNKHTDICMT